jgi:hypothetical protein
MVLKTSPGREHHKEADWAERAGMDMESASLRNRRCDTRHHAIFEMMLGDISGLT